MVFKHEIQIQVRFSDVDRLDHVNNACYHTYIESGRVHYLDQVLQRSVNWDKRGFILARMEMDHLVPIFLADEVWCKTKVCSLGNKSMKVHSLLVKRKNNTETICAEANGVLVAMDYEQNCSIALPEEWKTLIKAFEGSFD